MYVCRDVPYIDGAACGAGLRARFAVCSVQVYVCMGAKMGMRAYIHAYVYFTSVWEDLHRSAQVFTIHIHVDFILEREKTGLHQSCDATMGRNAWI